MNTTAGPIGEVAPPLETRWWAIAVGIGLAAVLRYGAALVSTDHLPGTSHPVAVPAAAVAPSFTVRWIRSRSDSVPAGSGLHWNGKRFSRGDHRVAESTDDRLRRRAVAHRRGFQQVPDVQTPVVAERIRAKSVGGRGE